MSKPKKKLNVYDQERIALLGLFFLGPTLFSLLIYTAIFQTKFLFFAIVITAVPILFLLHLKKDCDQRHKIHRAKLNVYSKAFPKKWKLFKDGKLSGKEFWPWIYKNSPHENPARYVV